MMKILIVDDDKDMCEVLSDFLRDEGYDTIVAYDGESALSNLENNKYDLLILDYQLHKIDGFYVLEKAHQIDSSLITIMISAFGNEQIQSRAKELGVYAFVEKPFDMDNMLEIVTQALSSAKK